MQIEKIPLRDDRGLRIGYRVNGKVIEPIQSYWDEVFDPEVTEDDLWVIQDFLSQEGKP